MNCSAKCEVRSAVLLSLIFLLPAFLNAQTPAPGKPSQPVADIGTFQYLPAMVVAGRTPGTTASVPPSLRVQFKLKDKSLKGFDTAAIYLFDKDGKPTQTLTKIDPSGFMPIPGTGGTPRKQTGQFPNMITETTDLKPGTPYNLIFPSPDKKEWKTAVIILGDSKIPSCVYKTIPTNVDITALEIKEKGYAIKN